MDRHNVRLQFKKYKYRRGATFHLVVLSDYRFVHLLSSETCWLHCIPPLYPPPPPPGPVPSLILSCSMAKASCEDIDAPPS